MNALRYARTFERLTPASVDDFDKLFTPDARFRDPFNDVSGVPAIKAVFRHMFKQCDRPRFEVLEIRGNDERAFFQWRFFFYRGDECLSIEGVSRVRFAKDGCVAEHIDYWDPSQLYEKLPLFGSIVRWLRTRLTAPQ